MDIALIILLVAFILVAFGMVTSNHFFTLAGGFLILISGILFISNPLSVDAGTQINQTSETTYEVTTNTETPAPLLNHAFNLILVMVGMMFMWDSYMKLMNEKYKRLEDYNE